MIKRVAVVGTGIMGHAIAENFLRDGKAVVVWNRTPQKTEDLVSKGAVLATSPKEATEQADIVFEVTADDESSQGVWTGDEGIFAGARRNQTLVTCATLSATWTDELAEQSQKQGVAFFDMAMTGGRPAAEAGQLTLLVGGNQAQLSELDPVLQDIAKEVKYFGRVGSGMRYKLVLQALQAVHMAGFGEAMKLAGQAGLPEKLTGDALEERPGGATTKFAWDGYQKEPDPINFSVAWIAKDLRYAKEMAAGGEYPFLDFALRRYEEAIREGKSDSDWTAITKDLK